MLGVVGLVQLSSHCPRARETQTVGKMFTHTRNGGVGLCTVSSVFGVKRKGKKNNTESQWIFPNKEHLKTGG